MKPLNDSWAAFFIVTGPPRRFAPPLPQAGEMKNSSLRPLAGEGGSREARDG